MSEAEQRLRESLGPSMLHHLYMLLAEHRAALSRARAGALEEAAKKAKIEAASLREAEAWDAAESFDGFAARIRTLITAPAPDSIPVERVREALRQVHDNIVDIASVNERTRLTVAEAVLAEVLERLGVDIDGTTQLATIPVEKVREEARRVLQSRAFKADPIEEMHAMMERLGVELDAKAETPADASHTCVACKHRLHAPNCCLGDKGECDCGCVP